MEKVKILLKDIRIILLILLVSLSVVAIHPRFGGEKGVIVTYFNTTMHHGKSSPVGKKLVAINGTPIISSLEYYSFVSRLKENETVRVKLSDGTYLTLKSGNGTLGMDVEDITSTNLRMGLDLKGGMLVQVRLIVPENATRQEIDMYRNEIIDTLKMRLNIYGLGDIKIRPWGKNYVLIEAAVQDPKKRDKIIEVLTQTGKFEAKIGNKTVFYGDDVTVTEAPRVYRPTEDYFKWEVPLYISKDGALRFQEITKNLKTVSDVSGKPILNETIVFYLDGANVSNATCLLYTSPSPRDLSTSRMPSSA